MPTTPVLVLRNLSNLLENCIAVFVVSPGTFLARMFTRNLFDFDFQLLNTYFTKFNEIF